MCCRDTTAAQDGYAKRFRQALLAACADDELMWPMGLPKLNWPG
jgi:hypothetical protein